MKKNDPAPQGNSPKRRRYSRVEIDCCAWLIVDNVRLRFDKVCNLSMGGACILGQSPLKPGDTCEFELYDTRGGTGRTFRYRARVVWTNADRMALEFIDMDTESYMFLQTMVLYHADDPLDVVEEFQDGFSSFR